MIPVIDLFAGPGGLGEGFSQFRDSRGRGRFSLAVSIEMERHAHSTLRWRALSREIGHQRALDALRRSGTTGSAWSLLSDRYPSDVAQAEREALALELGPKNDTCVRDIIRGRVSPGGDWVLIGGPPCQAYSLVGRARNRGRVDYDPEADRRQTLYVEYLQILADHGPAAFVMENVKGLLSARLASRELFTRISDDLADPARALRREGRRAGSIRPRYELRALGPSDGLGDDDPRRFVLHSERFGVPQRRHRVVILGVRSDLAARRLDPLEEVARASDVGGAIGDLPRIRSALSRGEDSPAEWLQHVTSVRSRDWIQALPIDMRRDLVARAEAIRLPRAGRGGELLESSQDEVVLNHFARTHMASDLDRYLYAAVFAAREERSPRLEDFPRRLLPAHRNVGRGIRDGLFSDRFRVQLRGEPATTITAHLAKDGHYFIHPDPTQCRSLTVREAARLQTFPDDYLFVGPRTAQYRQVGNAVPPRLATSIARAVSDLF